MNTPKHYDKPVQPWDLERHMETSGNAFVDARRTDAIEYCFRNKGDMAEDLRKARHCIDAALAALDAIGVEEYNRVAKGVDDTRSEKCEHPNILVTMCGTQCQSCGAMFDGFTNEWNEAMTLQEGLEANDWQAFVDGANTAEKGLT